MKTETWKKLRLTLPRLLEHANLDWRRLIVNQESGSLLRYEYPLSAKFFLSCAEKDFAERTPRGLVNALSNLKRAIDCQTDSHICAIGLSPSELPKQLGKSGIADLSQFTKEQRRPLTFRVLESLGIVAPGIVDRVRRIRHMLEHQYRKPTRAQVRDAIDIASLYVSALEGSMNSFLENVHLENGKMPHPSASDYHVPERSISLELQTYRDFRVRVALRDFKKLEESECRLSPRHASYLPFIRLFYAARSQENFERALSCAATQCGFVLPLKSIRIKEWTFG
jgi:hypothetical protein